MHFRKLKPYILTLSTIIITGYFKIALSHVLNIESPILLFFAAITFSAWYGGARQGLIAILASIAFIFYYFILPNDTTEASVWFIRLTLYTIDGAVIVYLCSRLRTSKSNIDAAFKEIKSVESSLRQSEERLRVTAKELAEANSQLEERVADRTRQLTETNKKLFESVIRSDESAERLRESQSFLDSVVENIPNMIFVKEAEDLRFIRFNRAGLDLIGQKSEDLIGKNDSDFFPKDEAQAFIQKDREVLRDGVMKEIFEEPLSTPKGLRYLHTRKIPIFDKNGKAQYLLGISEDITEKKAIEQQKNDYLQAQLARSEAEKSAARLEFLSEASVNLSKSLDIHTMLNAFSLTVTKSFSDACLIDFYDANENSLERIATAYKESVYQPALEDWSRKNNLDVSDKSDAISLAVKEGLTKISNGVENQLLVQTLKDVELTNKLLQNGTASLMVVPLIYHGRVFGALTLVSGNPGRSYGELDVSMGEDLAKRASFAIENARLFRKAKEASRAKSAFLANISHEIRTPLGAMLGFAELALSDETSVLAPEQKVRIDKVLRNGEQLLHIVDEVLDLSKAESDQIMIEKISFSLSKILDEVAALLMINATDRGLKLKITKPANMPEKITTDPLRLRQILINIIGNAIKFTEKGEIEVLVHFPKIGEKNYLQFTIKDTGIGITADQAAKLFQPFVQADSSMTRKFGGTGLGLFLARKLARLLGGDVILQSSSLGHGSQFEITVDISNSVNRENMETIKKDSTKAAAVKTQKRGHILVVDDSEDNRDLISAYLDKSNLSYDLAENGLEGVEKATQGEYDVILMDIQMPKMDGFEAVQYLRDRGYTKPVVAVTAHAMKGYRERCLNSGFDDYLGKPLAWSALMECLNKFLNSERTQEGVDHGI